MMTVWPSRLKVSSDRPLSHSSARSTMAGATRRPPTSTPARPATCSSSRRTPAADSTAMISMTRLHMPVRSDALTACKRQQHRRGHAALVRLRLILGQVLLDRQRPQPVQVRPVRQALPGHHRRGMSQRQRQVPQFGRYRGGSLGIGQAGPAVKELQPRQRR